MRRWLYYDVGCDCIVSLLMVMAPINIHIPHINMQVSKDWRNRSSYLIIRRFLYHKYKRRLIPLYGSVDKDIYAMPTDCICDIQWNTQILYWLGIFHMSVKYVVWKVVGISNRLFVCPNKEQCNMPTKPHFSSLQCYCFDASWKVHLWYVQLYLYRNVLHYSIFP